MQLAILVGTANIQTFFSSKPYQELRLATVAFIVVPALVLVIMVALERLHKIAVWAARIFLLPVLSIGLYKVLLGLPVGKILPASIVTGVIFSGCGPWFFIGTTTFLDYRAYQKQKATRL